MATRRINVVMICVTLCIFFVGFASTVRPEEECEVVGEKMVTPESVSAEFDLPKTKLGGVKLRVQQSAIEIQSLTLKYGGLSRDDEYKDVGTVQPGGETKRFDAPGRKAKITGVAVLYKFPDATSKGAVIQVLGCK